MATTRVAAFVLLVLATAGQLMAQDHPAIEVWFRAFIPSQTLAGPAKDYILAVPSPLGSVVRLLASDNAANLCFATDNRGFSADPKATSRLETRFVLRSLENGRAEVTPSDVRTTAAVTTKADCTSGKAIDQAPGSVNRDHLGAPAVADGVIQVIGQIQGRNVLTPAGSNGPSIDYSFSLRWNTATGSLTADVTFGSFPAFEVYARRPGSPWTPVIRAAPAGTPWQLGGDSFGINARRQVETVAVR